ncbi:MAG: FGGY-family carbohydrate kinase, partial [Promethearchaeota archaeon]
SSWEMENNTTLTYDEIVDASLKNDSFPSLIYPDDPRFLNPQDMLLEIRESCRKNGQEVPREIGEFASLIFKSLAFRYKQVIDDLEEITGKHVDQIHVVGGGSKNKLLSQYTANATNKPVLAGPSEATSIGNILLQSISASEIKDVKSARKIIINSFSPLKYEPQEPEKWEQQYIERYLPIVEKISKK